MGNSNIQAKFEQYQRQYPLYTRSVIVDLMLKDGVITPDVAKKIKSGTSLFLMENSTFDNCQITSDFSITKIFGGNFNNHKNNSKTNFNRRIESTFQSEKQGDCWLLSDINAMNQTEWGRQAIYDAIIPDKDGSRGVTIKFKGSPLKQKSFHITAKEIQIAKESGYYSKGDDDMIAFELATEKLSKLAEKSGLGKRISSFDKFTNNKSYIAGGGIYDKNGNTLDISELITGIKDIEISFSMKTKVQESFLKEYSNNINNTSAVCTFSTVNDLKGRAKNDPVHGNHAYAIKKFIYKKEVIVIDPYHADQEIKLSWNKFINDVERLTISSKNLDIKNNLEKYVSQNLKKEIIESKKKSVKMNDDSRKHEVWKNINEKIFPEIAEILINFDISAEDIIFENIPESPYAKNIFDIEYKSLRREHKGKLNKTTENVNKDNVILLLDIKPDFISILDKYKSGLGNGKEKKALISPIINALAEKANAVGISKQEIESFKNRCFKELNAFIYTDEKIIIEEVNKIRRLIKQKN